MYGASCGSPTGSPARCPRGRFRPARPCVGRSRSRGKQPGAGTQYRLVHLLPARRAEAGQVRFRRCRSSLPSTSARGLWLRGREKSPQAIALADNGIVTRKNVTRGTSRTNYPSRARGTRAEQPTGEVRHAYEINRECGHFGRRRGDRACINGGRRAADGRGSKGRDGCGQGEVLRRRAQGSKRLRCWSGHHLPGHLDRRLPGQCLEVRAGRHLRVDRGARWRPRHAPAFINREQLAGEREITMSELATFKASRAPADSRFPAHSIAGLAGTSFKHQHLPAILAERKEDGFFEVHAENYMGAGGPPHEALARICRDFPVSLHGVCMSIGGPQPLDATHLGRFKSLVDRYEPALVSEHLAWSTHDTTFLNDLLPLPYTRATLARVADHIDEVQETIGRPILLENPSTYVLFEQSTMSETDFIREVVRRTGCGLLLDVNNVFVSATNHGYSALAYLTDFPLGHVGEIHLAGHSEQADDEGDLLLIDSHDGPVADAVWKLFEIVIRKCGPVPTLIEWDSNIPDWPILKAEATAAQAMLDRYVGCSSLDQSHAA